MFNVEYSAIDAFSHTADPEQIRTAVQKQTAEHLAVAGGSPSLSANVFARASNGTQTLAAGPTSAPPLGIYRHRR